MVRADYQASPREVKTFAVVEIVMTAVFMVLLYFALGGLDAPFLPWWMIVLLLAVVAVSGFFAERVWLQAEPLDPDDSPDSLRDQALGAYAAQTVRKLWICNASIGIAIVVAFVTDHGAWPLVVGGIPGLLLLTWEIWPSLRNLSMSEVILEDEGARSGLVESFRSW